MNEISSAVHERWRLIWDECLSQCARGPLPFIQVDPDNPDVLVSAWNVTDTGDEIDDLARGICYADLLVYKAKNVRGNFDPFQLIQEVLVAIGKKGDPGTIAKGFLSRIAMFALAGSLN